MTVMTAETIRLIYPKGADDKKAQLSESDFNELGLATVVHALNLNRNYTQEIKSIFRQLSYDPDVIRYRLDVLEDLLNHPELMRCLEVSLEVISELKFTSG